MFRIDEKADHHCRRLGDNGLRGGSCQQGRLRRFKKEDLPLACDGPTRLQIAGKSLRWHVLKLQLSRTDYRAAKALTPQLSRLWPMLSFFGRNPACCAEADNSGNAESRRTHPT